LPIFPLEKQIIRNSWMIFMPAVLTETETPQTIVKPFYSVEENSKQRIVG